MQFIMQEQNEIFVISCKCFFLHFSCIIHFSYRKQVQSTEALLAHDSGAESEKTKDEICYPEGLEDLCNKFADVYTSLVS